MAYALLTDLRAYLGVDGTTDDDLLRDCLTRATAAIDTYTGRTFACTSATTKYHDAIHGTCGATLFLDGDCCQITSVVNGDGETISSTYYVTKPLNETPYYAIKLKGSSGYVWTYDDDPDDAIAVTGYWSWSRVAPDDVVQACLRYAAWLYRMKDAAVFDGSYIPEQGTINVQPGLPKDVVQLIDHYRKRVG